MGCWEAVLDGDGVLIDEDGFVEVDGSSSSELSPTRIEEVINNILEDKMKEEEEKERRNSRQSFNILKFWKEWELKLVIVVSWLFPLPDKGNLLEPESYS